MTTTNFEIGKSYGNDLTIDVLAKSKSFVTIKSSFGTSRVKIYTDKQGEKIFFKCWTISAYEVFDPEIAKKIFYQRMNN